MLSKPKAQTLPEVKAPVPAAKDPIAAVPTPSDTRRKRVGVGSTIATGAQGVLDSASTAKKTLLGA